MLCVLVIVLTMLCLFLTSVGNEFLSDSCVCSLAVHPHWYVSECTEEAEHR